MLYASLGNLSAVDRQRSGAALSDAFAVISEFKCNGMSAGFEGILRRETISGKAEEII